MGKEWLTDSLQGIKQVYILRIFSVYKGFEVVIVHHVEIMIWVERLTASSPSHGLLRRQGLGLPHLMDLLREYGVLQAKALIGIELQAVVPPEVTGCRDTVGIQLIEVGIKIMEDKEEPKEQYNRKDRHNIPIFIHLSANESNNGLSELENFVQIPN